MDNVKDNGPIIVVGLCLTVILIPVAIGYYLYMKSKSKKVLYEAYVIERELDYHFKSYMEVKDKPFTNLDELLKVKKSAEDKKNELYAQYEILDRLDTSVNLIAMKMEKLKSQVAFLKAMKMIKVTDQIMEKDLSKYNIRTSELIAEIDSKKKVIYNTFRYI